MKRAMLVCLALSLLTACWDRVEIDQRGFVVGIAVDRLHGKGGKPQEAAADNPIRATYQFITPAGLKGPSGSGGGGGGGSGSRSGSGAYFNIGVDDNSLAALSSKLAAKTSRAPYFEHLKLIVISSELAANDQDFGDVIDYFLRNREMRRAMHVAVSDGKASDVLDVKALNESYPVGNIESAIRNTTRNNTVLPETNIGDIHENLLKGGSFTVQRIRATDKGISLAGAVLMGGREKRLVGILNGAETEGLNFLRGEVTGGIVEAEYKNKAIAFEVERASRYIETVKGSGPGPYDFAIRIEAEGTVAKSVRGLDLTQEKEIRRIEKLFAAAIEEAARKAIHTLQYKYKKDALDLGEYLHRNRYADWRRVSEKWEDGENLFSKTRINVTANVQLRQIGNINESERR